jgi:AraC-like DNA-binding protein
VAEIGDDDLADRLWRPAVDSEALQQELQGLGRLLDPELPLDLARKRLVGLLGAMVRELSLPGPVVRQSDATGAAARRVHERLHSDASQRTDLATLAQLVGMSRFQALRVFKRHYGLPPQAYQLRLRLSLAQRALREGVPPARVAAEFGFTDQSHLTRHFKRALGITPAMYARAGTAARTSSAAAS